MQTDMQVDVTCPPPPLDDSFPHVRLLEQITASDKLLVKHFLSQRSEAVRTKSDQNAPKTDRYTDIPQYRNELRAALLLLERLNRSKIDLENMLQPDGDDSERHQDWTTELDQTVPLEEALRNKLDFLQDPARLQILYRKLATRRKKRAWQRRHNKRLAEKSKQLQKKREKRLEEIALWEADWDERLNRERATRDELLAKSAFLADVRRRKARAKRNLRTFEKTVYLRNQQRPADVSAAEGKQQRSSEVSEERFRRDIDHLITEWKAKLSEYVKEEKRLKDELARRSTGNESRRRENRWRKALFGDAASGPLNRKLINDPDELIAIRRAWDVYALSHSFGSDELSSGCSAVPFGWVKPPENALPEWQMYRENHKTKEDGNTAPKT
ncbi:uncharacterized protein LOC131209140 [Anopheles bellator]|uniref:uncharacterized protein LOC131209140 n=1 Tax=Anopheles bellator TaxID=139047 RepID=UPI00264A2B16|nr:uncharacterized protein LOC131209140 [Anopheles bellator]